MGLFDWLRDKRKPKAADSGYGVRSRPIPQLVPESRDELLPKVSDPDPGYTDGGSDKGYGDSAAPTEVSE